MTMEATPIRRIYDEPGHPSYGPVRRLWIMLEQITADFGGIVKFEQRIWRMQVGLSRDPIFWDRHLVNLIAGGQSEASAQRTVLQQLIVASEWIR